MSKQIGIPTRVVTVLASVLFVASWSSGFLIAAIATADVAVLTLLVWRFVPLAVALIAVVLASGALKSVAPRALRGQAVVGLFAQFGYVVLVYAAIASGVTAGTTALIDAVQPLVVATLVGPLLGLRVRGVQWAGLVVGASGVVLVVQSQMAGSDAPPTAFVLPGLAMACLVAATFLDRRSPSTLPVLVTLTVHVTVTALALLVLGAATGTLAPPASAVFWLQTVLSALIPTVIAYGLYWWLLRRVGITVLNALLFLVAPATALAGWVVLGEPMTVLTLVGFVLCGGGVAVVLATDSAGRASRVGGARKTTAGPLSGHSKTSDSRCRHLDAVSSGSVRVDARGARFEGGEVAGLARAVRAAADHEHVEQERTECRSAQPDLHRPRPRLRSDESLEDA